MSDSPALPSAACLDPEMLSAYVDRQLTAEDRASIEAHLAECADCYVLLTEVMRTSDEMDETVLRPSFIRRHLWSVGASGLAAAAALVLLVRVVGPGTWLSPRAQQPGLQELVAAVATEATRPVEGRLSGGFAYRPAPAITRGGAAREVSPEVRIAAANLEKAARDAAAPGHRAALGIAYLTLGELDRAIETLEGAALEDPLSAGVQNDVSAAYLARAKFEDRADDWTRALNAADRALKLDPTLIEPYFNRALALEGLNQIDQALAAWARYQSVDSSTEWSAEAAQHRRSLEERRQRPGA